MKLTTSYGEGMNHEGPCWPLGMAFEETKLNSLGVQGLRAHGRNPGRLRPAYPRHDDRAGAPQG
jgi:hypothetical protein